MRSKLFSRLMSFTLSATVALTSGIPALAYDGGGGDLPEEELEILDLEEAEDEDLGSDFDAENELLDDIDVEDEAEFLNGSYTITFSAANSQTASQTKSLAYTGDSGTAAKFGDSNNSDVTLPTLPAAAAHYKKVNDNWHKTDADDGDVIGDDTEFTNDTTVYGRYRLIEATVTDYDAVFVDAEGHTVTHDKPDFSGLSVSSADWTPTLLSSLTQPAVDGFVAGGWYIDSEFTKTAQDDLDAQTDDKTYAKLYAKYTVAPEAAASALSLKVEATSETGVADATVNQATHKASFAYATATETAKYTVMESSDATGSPYTNVDFTFYKYKDSYKVTSASAAGDFLDANLEEINLAAWNNILNAHGLSAAITSAGVITISNEGSNYAFDDFFVVEITDKSSNADATVSPKRVKINLVVEDATMTASATSGWTTSPDTLAFGDVTMGYEVVGPTDTAGAGQINASEVTLSATYAKANKIDNLSFEWKTGDIFEYECDGTQIWNGNPAALIINPIEGLSSAGTEKAYEDTLYIKSNAWTTPKEIKVTVTIKNDLAFTSVKKHKGTTDIISTPEATRLKVTLPADTTEAPYVPGAHGFYADANTATTVSTDPRVGDSPKAYYLPVYDLGTFNVGESFNDVVITAAGGKGTVNLKEYAYDPSAFTLTAVGGATTILGEGVEGTKSTTEKKAVYTVASTGVTDDLGATRYFALEAVSDNGEFSYIKIFKYTIGNRAIEVSVENDTIPVAVSSGSYTWYVSNGYTASEAAKTVTITNKSATSMTVTATVWGESGCTTAKTDFAVSPSEQFTIGSGASRTLTVTPAAGLSSTDRYIKLAVSGSVDTIFKMAMVKNASDLEITKPYDALPATEVAIDNAKTGKAYSYQFGVTKSSTVGDVAWSVTSLTVDGESPITDGTQAAALKKLGLELSEATGILSGTPNKAATIKLTVQATASATVYATRKVSFTVANDASAFKIMADGKVMPTTSGTVGLDLGEFTIDKLGNVSKTFTVINDTSLDMEGIKITASSAPTANVAVLTFSSNKALNADIIANGFDLAAGESKEFVLTIDTDVFTSANTQTITITTIDKATDSDYTRVGASNAFDVKIVGIANHLIDESGVLSFNLGKEIVASQLKQYKVKDGATDVTKKYSFAWQNGGVPGLELASDGVITGTPTQVGEFEVTVVATNKTDAKKTTVKTHTITINGTATLAITSPDYSAAGSIENKNLLLPSMIVGDAGSGKAAINVKANSEIAKNVKVTVTDAEDNRDSTWAEDIVENPANPYEGSSNYIGVSYDAWASISKGATQSFNIVSKGSPTAGVYKVKITITADNANTVVFYAIMVVVDKFALTQPDNVATYIGAKFDPPTGTKTLKITSTGGAAAQTITWEEAGTEVTEGSKTTTEFYVTKKKSDGTSMGAKATGSSDVSSIGLLLVDMGGPIGVATSTTPAKNFTVIEGTMKNAGDFTVNLKAKLNKVAYTVGAGTDPVSKIINLSHDSLGGSPVVKPDDADVYVFPEQEAATVSFTISSTKSDKVFISDVTYPGVEGTLNGRTNGTQYVTRVGFDYDPVVKTYTNTSLKINVKVKNPIGVDVTAKAELSEDSSFEISGDKSHVVAKDNGEFDFVIMPKAKLAVGTYTDTLKITGNDFETVQFALSFTVEDNTYRINVDDGEAEEDRIVYVDKNVESGVAVELGSYVAGGSAANKTLTIRNSGNTTINNVSVTEVKADKTTEYPTGSADAMINFIAPPTTLAGSAVGTFKITAKKSSVGSYSTYAKIHFEEGTGTSAVKHDVVIPVEYVVFGNDLEVMTVDPSGDTEWTLTEGYKPDDSAVDFTVRNKGTEVTETLRNITASITGGSYVTIKPLKATEELAPGENVVYTIAPVKGLPEGTYETTIRVTADNLKTPIKRTIKITVAASSTYTVRTDSTGDTFAAISNSSFSTRLYNTFIGLNERAAADNKSPKVTFAGNNIVKVDFDNTGDDVQFTFTGTGSATPTELTGTYLTAVTAFKVETLTTSTISASSKSIVLADAVAKKAKMGLGSTTTSGKNNGDAKCFTQVNVDFYNIVTFAEGGGTRFVEKSASYDGDYVRATATDSDGYADTSITAYVAYGSTLASVFPDGLPTSYKAGSVMQEWRDAAGNEVSLTKLIRTDYNATPVFHTHEYAAGTVKDEQYVKWVWTKDEKGNLSAVLHLFCVDPKCPDHDGSEVIVDGTKTTTIGTLTYDSGTKTDADCEHGEGNTFTVTADVLAAAIGTATTYVGEYVETESGEPLGHKYDLLNPAKITWTDANADKKMTADEIKITRVCTRDETHIAELKVVKVERNAEKSQLPTCLKPGYDIMSITYMEITEKGEDDKEVTVDYDQKFVVPATGHSKELEEIVEGFDEDTLKATVTIKCKNENCDAEDHIVFGPADVQFAEQADGTFAAEVTLTDGTKKTISYVNHAHVWTPTWKWTAVEGDAEKKTVELTLTCNVGAKAHTKTFSDTITATKNGLVWTWAASFEYDGKTYSDSKTEVRDEETGEEIEVEDISGGKGIVITLYRDEYNYTGSPIKPTDFSVLDLERDNDYYLNPGTEYSVSYKNNTKVGEAEIIIKGKGNYAGKATSAKFKIVNPYPDDVEAPVVKGATLKLPKATYTFNNEEQFPATVEFGLKGQTAKTYTFDGGSYVDSEGNPLPAAWTCENNRNAGTATFAVLGVKDSKGQPTAVKKTFKIQAATLDTTNFKVLVGGQEKDFEMEWFAKGATPWVDIVWANGDNEYGLWSGKDFTVSYKNNKKVGTASVTIKGKGNFKGTLKDVATFKINALDLSETWLQAVTVKAGNKGKQVKVTVVDHHDNIIPASKYTVSVTDASTGADLTNTKLTAGMEILVKAVAKDSTAVAGETDERPVTIAADFSKASVKVASGFYKEYTGQAIELTDTDMKNITVTIKVGKEKKTLVYGEDFFIAGTADNVNKGTMTVTIVGNAEADTERGIPAFSGSKTFKVKIKARQLPLK